MNEALDRATETEEYEALEELDGLDDLEEPEEDNAKRLKELQALPLERKILITQARIMEWHQHYKGQIYVSYSGGKDSTVLLDIARRIYPDIQAVFVNTGLEYPEIRGFALSHENVLEIRPRWGKAGKEYGKSPTDLISFLDTLTIYGYPIISKAVSNAIVEARRTGRGCSRWKRLHGEYKRLDGGHSQYDYSKYLPLFYLPFRISDECCKVTKKGPAHIYQHATGKRPIIATMAEESIIRKQAWITQGGCNAFKAKEPTSKPMSFWGNQDVLRYILKYGLDMCSVYGDIATVGTDGLLYPVVDGFYTPETPLACTGCERTGCIFCAFGAHLEKGDGRFRRLAKTHPRQYEFCIGGGEWRENNQYDPTITDKELWNPKKLWMPNKKGLGMGKVFDMLNDIYGKDFIRY